MIRLASALITVIAMLGVTVGAAMSASAEAQPVTFDEQSTTTINYGEQWWVGVISDGRFASGVSTVEMTGPVSDTRSAQFYLRADGATSATSLPAFDSELLDAGVYELSVTVRMPYYGENLVSSSATPAVITVEPASIASDLQIISDPNNQNNAIISLRMTGDYIDNALYRYLNYQDIPANYPETPAGTWFVSIKDADGTVAFDQSIVQERGGGPFTSIYWTGYAPDTVFTGEARFEASAESAQNFDIAPIAPFSYTSSPERPDPVVEAGVESDSLDTVSDGFRPAVWMLWTSGLVAIGLLIAMSVLVARSRKKPALAGPEVVEEVREVEQ